MAYAAKEDRLPEGGALFAGRGALFSCPAGGACSFASFRGSAIEFFLKVSRLTFPDDITKQGDCHARKMPRAFSLPRQGPPARL